MLKIIFVCTGNTCRSPLAESYAKHTYSHHHFESRGIMADGGNVSTHSQQIITDHQLPEASIPQALLPKDVEDSILLTMTMNHKQYIEALFPHAHVHLLSEYAGFDAKDVSDPFGGSAQDYERVYSELRKYIDCLQFE